MLACYGALTDRESVQLVTLVQAVDSIKDGSEKKTETRPKPPWMAALQQYPYDKGGC